MAQKSDFFKSISGDRDLSADRFAERFRDFLIEGVFVDQGSAISTELEVTSVGGLGVQINLGTAALQGYFYKIYSSAEGLTLSAGNTTNDRIDRIILELNVNDAQRDVVVKVLEGTPAGIPTAPALTQDLTVSGIYQISLAQILVIANASSIAPGNITDERSDSSLCGLADINLNTGTIGSRVTVDDSAFTRLTGTDSQSLFDNIDDILESATTVGAANQLLRTGTDGVVVTGNAGVQIGTAAKSRVYTTGSNLYIQSISNMYFDIDSDNNETGRSFFWRNYLSSIMTLDESGNLGVVGSGTFGGVVISGSSTKTLTVNTTSAAGTSSVGILMQRSSVNSWYMGVGIVGSNDDLNFYDYSGTAGSRMTLTKSGNLSVVGSFISDNDIQLGSIGRDNKIVFGGSTGGAVNQNFIDFGLSGFGDPGEFNVGSKGDKLIFWDNGIDIDAKMGVSLTDNIWVKGQGSTGANAFAVFGNGNTTGLPSRLLTVTKSGNLSVVGSGAFGGNITAGTSTGDVLFTANVNTGGAFQFKQTDATGKFEFLNNSSAVIMTLENSGALNVIKTVVVGNGSITTGNSMQTNNVKALEVKDNSDKSHLIIDTVGRTVSTSPVIILSATVTGGMAVISGTDGTNSFVDLVVFGTGLTTPNVLHSTTILNSPSSRTYSSSSGDLRLGMASGSYAVKVQQIGG